MASRKASPPKSAARKSKAAGNAPRTRGRLKVFMTQIGFHNWLVAAPSQKAALAAWDVRENLFAMGSAQIVNDPECIDLAMNTPGVPVPVDAKHALAKATRVLRLDDHPARRKKAAVPAPPPAPKVDARKRKADRAKLEKAEAALADFHKRSVRERAAIIRAQKALDVKAEALEVDLAAEEEELEAALEAAREAFETD